MMLNFQRLHPNAVIPQRATSFSAGVDLCACLDDSVTLKPHEIKKIPTGLAVSPSDKNVALLIFARSGLATKFGVALANGVGVVDADYRGELGVVLVNLSQEDFTVNDGERIAQLVFAKHEQCNFVQVDVLDETERGEGGYGHTGVK